MAFRSTLASRTRFFTSLSLARIFSLFSCLLGCFFFFFFCFFFFSFFFFFLLFVFLFFFFVERDRRARSGGVREARSKRKSVGVHLQHPGKRRTVHEQLQGVPRGVLAGLGGLTVAGEIPNVVTRILRHSAGFMFFRRSCSIAAEGTRSDRAICFGGMVVDDIIL